uniref:Ig-like domain-containing protein n=1 Tax=Timema cristinae TaxID=61476 RepID=A0A7R9CRN0_TIMCR|nr:unnamed protein product [Timema cristinae]
MSTSDDPSNPLPSVCVLTIEQVNPHVHGERVESHLGKTIPISPELVSNLVIPILGSLAQYETSANYATEAGNILCLPQLDISGLVGQTIRLPCNVDMEKCGNLHSIKWYRGSSRIFVFSEMAKIARSEGDYVERHMTFILMNFSLRLIFP